MKIGKWIGGGLGWAFGGPIGALVGFALGSVLDGGGTESKTQAKERRREVQTEPGDFGASLVVLASCVMKSDGKVLQSELSYVRSFLLKQFGAEKAKEYLLVLREVLKREVPIREVCFQIKQYMNLSSRLQLLHFLFGIAAADGAISEKEYRVLFSISGYLGVSQQDYLSIKSMFVQSSTSDYQILEITKDVNDEEVKKAYRKMAMKYHPDKVAHLGEEVQKAANEKFQKVQKAFENIKKSRGIA
ncbi:MAG: DnaJ domain-containing protein [Bacteroidetes bacterium]|nr:molecular chaperone DjiA [Bacteroidota bacterium]MBV6460010.1 DnaJ-like protein DjlA [Flavobacteriales bacterium]WKZ76346.1 MAG: TerB family tellurite resistance protein [Vicingaceae bacterium]MCL4816268.1 TerB family tellurite resistance protein [Flavobacteriales bacterium]NOG95405.1 DnaJ domain-containing protein [Bacteroidota bacterium]